MRSGGSYAMECHRVNPEDEFFAEQVAKGPKLRTVRQLFYHTAFQELETERQIGMAVGYIPITKIWEWADYHDLTRSETRALVHVIRAMDGWQMEFNAKHQGKGT